MGKPSAHSVDSLPSTNKNACDTRKIVEISRKNNRPTTNQMRTND